ncbi:12621_t:CDS:2, partial [Funneliformis mosseae]
MVERREALMLAHRYKGRITKQASCLFLILEEIKEESSLREYLVHGDDMSNDCNLRNQAGALGIARRAAENLRS